ncbi:tRNA-splicing endonuclease subunit Sen34-like [Ostrea edulis]|uniref:tRNA-splicing endonuclease subunit Sen34-like n=1 Tax=Ostrea edulis TaxID=37623 RepID=UPI002094D7F6|nr:tRNA-splicing endonuclease subunit Sen34-like [Ostrea edulis]
MNELKPIKVYLQNDKPLVWSARDSVELREQWRIVGCLIGCLPRLPRQNNYLGLPLQLSKEEVTLLLEKGAILLLNNSSDLKQPSVQEKEEFNEYRQKSYQAQVEMFREERKKEIHQNMANIIEGKRDKAQKDLEERKSRGEVSEEAEVEEDFSIDVDKVPIPPIPKKFSLVQLFTESPYKPEDEVPVVWGYPTSEKERLKFGVYRDLWNQGYFLSNGSKFGGDFLVYPGDPSRYHSHYIAICIPHEKKMSALDIVSMGRLGSNVRKTVLLCSEGPDNKISYISLQWTGIS